MLKTSILVIMNMKSLPKVLLFIGYPLSPQLMQALDLLPENLKSIYIDPEEPYLHNITVDEDSFLGKYFEGQPSFEELELLSKNISSILHKIFPEYSFDSKLMSLLGVYQ